MDAFAPAPRKAAVVGRKVALGKKLLLAAGFALDEKRPQLVLCVGGDGSVLHAERRYPGVPKLVLRDSLTCGRCDKFGSLHFKLFHCPRCAGRALARIRGAKKVRVALERKLEGTATTARGKLRLLALNEVQVHNNSPRHAIRGAVFSGNRKLAEFIGDGVIVATPYGSTGYFYAASKKKFSKGMGIAFNNPTKKLAPIIVGEKSVVRIVLSRRHGLFVADNNPKTKLLGAGDEVTVRYSKESARFVRL